MKSSDISPLKKVYLNLVNSSPNSPEENIAIRESLLFILTNMIEVEIQREKEELLDEIIDSDPDFMYDSICR